MLRDRVVTIQKEIVSKSNVVAAEYAARVKPELRQITARLTALKAAIRDLHANVHPPEAKMRSSARPSSASVSSPDPATKTRSWFFTRKAPIAPAAAGSGYCMQRPAFPH